MDVGSHSDEDGPDEEEEEVEDGDQLVEHAVATVVHLGGRLVAGPARVCLKSNTCNVKQSYRVALYRLNVSKNSVTHVKRKALNGGFCIFQSFFGGSVLLKLEKIGYKKLAAYH